MDFVDGEQNSDDEEDDDEEEEEEEEEALEGAKETVQAC